MTPAGSPASAVWRRAIGGTLGNYAGRLVTLLMWFALTPLLLHQLGVSAYGRFALVSSIVAYGSLLDAGISIAVVKHVAEHVAKGERTAAKTLLATAFRLYTLLGVAVILLAAIVVLIVPFALHLSEGQRAEVVALTLITGATIGISLPCTTGRATLRGLQRHDLASMATAGASIVAGLATLLVLLLGGGVPALLAVNIPAAIFAQCWSLWLVHGTAPDLLFRWSDADRRLSGGVMSFSASMLAVQFGAQLEARTDEIVIASALPVAAIAPYVIAQKLSSAPALLAEQFVKVLLPAAATLHAIRDENQLRDLYLRGTRMTLAIFLPVACVIVLLTRPIIRVWVGNPDSGNADVVLILTLAAFAAMSQWPGNLVLQGMGRHRPLAVISIISGVMNLTFSLILVRAMGIVGVAVGTLIPSALMYFGVMLPCSLRALDLKLRQVARHSFLPAILPAVPVAGMLMLLRFWNWPSSGPSTFLAAGVSLALYFGCYLSNPWTAFERKILMSGWESGKQAARLAWGRAQEGRQRAQSLERP